MEEKKGASAPEKPEGKKGDRKQLIIQVVVVLVCLAFILESFAFGNKGSSNKPVEINNQTFTGVADVNVTVMDYRPYLYVDGMLNSSAKAQAMEIAGVDEVIDETARSVISVSDSSRTPEVYSQLKRKNITTYTLATLGMPAYFEMILANGSKANVAGTRFDYMTEPVSKVGGKMLMRLVIVTIGETPTGMSSITPMLSTQKIDYDAEISESTGKTFYYSIPWEDRNLDVGALKSEFGATNVDYIRNDNVLLAASLSPQEMISKKFDYVVTISERAISAGQNFTDRDRVLLDFGQDSVFMNSSLVIHSETQPELNFTPDVKYIYTIRLPEKIGEYNFYTDSAEVITSGEMNGTIPVTINASVLGETVMGITEVSERR
jgi:hypothetical protein